MSQVSPVNVNNEYQKQHDIKPEDVKGLREWIGSQPHLPQCITDLDIILALHSCNCNTERTKEVLDLNFTLRNFFSFYQNRQIDNTIETALESWLITPLTTLSKKGYRPIYCQILDPSAEKFQYPDVVKAFVMVVDLLLYEEGTLPGLSIILNMDRVSLEHMSRVDLVVAQQFFYFLQEAMFVRLKEFHFINAPSFMDRMLTMFKPFMKEDMLKMLHVHVGNSRTLDEFLFNTALPEDAGGENLNSLQLKEKIWNKVKANDNFFKEESKKKVDECKRPSGPKNMSTFFPSLEGTFKLLSID